MTAQTPMIRRDTGPPGPTGAAEAAGPACRSSRPPAARSAGEPPVSGPGVMPAAPPAPPAATGQESTRGPAGSGVLGQLLLALVCGGYAVGAVLGWGSPGSPWRWVTSA